MVQVARAYTWSDADRDDLMQEILLQCWKSMATFRGENAIATWFYRIALNTAMNWKRKDRTRTRRQESFVEIFKRSDSRSMADSDSQRREASERLHGAIRQLDTADRALVLLHLDQLSHRDIASVLGITDGNVGVRLHRVREKLRALMRSGEHE